MIIIDFGVYLRGCLCRFIYSCLSVLASLSIAHLRIFYLIEALSTCLPCRERTEWPVSRMVEKVNYLQLGWNMNYCRNDQELLFIMVVGFMGY